MMHTCVALHNRGGSVSSGCGLVVMVVVVAEIFVISCSANTNRMGNWMTGSHCSFGTSN